MTYETILVETRGRVGIIRLNRPQALNALNAQLNADLTAAIDAFEADETIGCVIVTGSEKAFAAGADIKEMSGKSHMDVYREDFAASWDRVARMRKPVIAAVSGFALGGGCELAMQCDVVIAADTAKFGQPEIKLGVMPGAGCTQRLTRAIGKARAMELILTGRTIRATEAEAMGLVTKVVQAESTLDESLALAARIAAQPPVAVRAAKQAILRAQELSLSAGLDFERRAFFLLFASDDQTEGMAAFSEKRPPRWTGR